MNIVIDTNVLISALKSKRGASYKLIMALPKELYTPNVSVPLFLEYESVAKRQGLVSKLSSQDIDSILEYFLSKSSIRKIFFLWRPYLKDPKDDLVLEVAVESQSEYIVTFNTKDFKGCNQFGITVVTPQEFIAIRGI
ncbi:putative toxin-antitoxin system toxin component, PIN family [Methyloprofundus sp.]|uniref:putative toxin-antitoxin system toxin component, PIN family n=1 Tax=Methyloprofundus sp. TaxID=2020875 RepID=UPI003D0CD937